MTGFIRALLNLGLLCVSLMVILGMTPRNDGCQSGDCRGLPELLKALIREQRRSAVLESSLDVIIARTAEKEKITQELLARRITLLEASTRFRSLNELVEDGPVDHSTIYVGASEEERTCREVISWAHAIAGMTSRGEAETVVRRLEDELQHYLKAEGEKGKAARTR